MAITFVKHIGNASGAGTVTIPTGGVAVGDLLVLRCFSYSGGGAPAWSVSDTKSNTWVATTSLLSYATFYGQVYHCFVTTALVASTDSITLAANATVMAIDQFTGVGTTHSSPAGTEATFGGTTSVTKAPASSGSLVLGIIGIQNGSGACTADADTLEGSWSTLTTVTSTTRHSQAQYKIVTGTSTQTYNPGIVGGWSDGFATVLAAFPEGGPAAKSILQRRPARSTRAILQAR